MGKTRLEQIEEIYHAAIDQPPERRGAFLDDSCGSDGELRREVESLLRYDNSGADFIDSPPAMLAAEMFARQEEKSALTEGGQISRYKIERLLGEGGMGEVYLAEDSRLGRRVALKVLPQSIVADAERLMRFEREARAASALNHPNIITIHEFGEDKGVHFIASEFVDGVTLRQKIASGVFGLTEAVDVAIQISSALSAAHDAGITHRDIKPENVMIRPDGYVKVLDFGLAKLTQRRSASTDSGSEDPTMALNRTMQGVVMGTAAYMSPEQARGIHVDARTDIWSLGAVIFEMVTGRKPFSGETHADTIVSVLQHEPPAVSTIAPHIPSEIDRIISRALSKKVEDRYQTAAELRTDLEKIRKQIESDRESGPAAGDATLIVGTDTAATSPNEAEPTNGAQDRKREAWSFWPSRSSADSPRQFSIGRIPVAIIALVLIAIASATIYFVFVASGDRDRIDSIAVLPLENSTGNPDLAYISDGVSESLIDRLAQLPQMKVISRSSSFKFRGSNVDIGDIARQLGVRVVVTGSVARVGEDVAIRTEVVDAVENRHLGGGQYRYKSGDLLGMQNEIASKTAEQLKIKLTDGQSKRLAERDTENSESYRYYLNGLVARTDDSAGGRAKALKFFEKAAELDPEFANAYAEIASLYWSQANSSDDPNELMPKAKAAAEKALTLDSESAKAHVVRAMVYEFEFNWTDAEREYRRAIEISPNLDFARNNFAFFLSIMDRQNEALAQLEEQRVRDPLNRRLFLLQKAIVLVQARKFDEALQTYQAAQAVEPDNEIPDFALGYTYAGKGLYDEAVTYYKKAVADAGDEKYSQPLVYLAAAYARMPQKQAEARVILSRIENMPGYRSPALLAAVYSALDENDRAIELLEQSYIKRDLLLRYIGVAYEYDGLRTDPRFVDLTKRIGLAR